MVHADASNFAANVTKEEAYQQVLDQAEGLFYEQRNWVCNLSNCAALLWHAFKSLPAPSNQVNWAGPFQGKVACQTIAFGRGVCGAAAATKTTQLVPDVDAFPGHIACDGDSKSEIVVPIVVDDRVVAIIDVDCAELNGFDEVDKVWLEKLADLVGRSCDWP
uniref:Uncharacterized protein 123A4.170 n=1 Tax=Neurospora crassa TaxID=5141 RepID=Q8X0X5_NEUCS|nr:conserved hypothetical protein [Neurospora crassa]